MGSTISTNSNLLQKDTLLNKWVYRTILFLVVFIPFEDFLLKFLPVPDKIYFYARFLSEGIIYALFAIVIARKLIKGIPLAKTPLDTPIIVFVQIVLLSMVVNDADKFATIVTIRPVIRYVLLFYLVVNINVTLTQASKILRYCIYTGAGQVLIGMLQYASRGAIDGILQPRASEADIGGVTKDFVVLEGREIGSIYGAAGDTVLLGLFLVLYLIFVASKLYISNHEIVQSDRFYVEKTSIKKKNIILIALVLGTLIAIGLTYVRACMFLAFLILIAYTSLKFYSKKRVGIIVIVVSLLIPTVSIGVDYVSSLFAVEYSGNARREEQSVMDNLTGIFTSDYIEVARQQRLGALTDIPLTVISNRPFLGYGPDQLKSIEDLNDSPISFLNKEWKQEGFKDVYWVSTMTFYGLAGLLTMIWTFQRLYKWSKTIYSRTRIKVIKEIALIVFAVSITTIFLQFFYRVIEFRIYSLYFWLFPALMFNLYSKEKAYLKRSR